MPLLFPGAGGRKEFLEAFRVAPGSKVPVEKAAGQVEGAPMAGGISPGGNVPVERAGVGVASPMSAGIMPPGGAITGQGLGQGLSSAFTAGPAQQLT